MESIKEGDVNTYESILFKSDENLDALYYPKTQIMHFIWKRRSVGQIYRQAFLDGITYSKDHPVKFFLSDIRRQGVVGPEDRKWFETVALPGAIENGVTKVGIVFEGNVFKKYYINVLLQHFVSKGVPMRFFSTAQRAIEWLINEKEK